MKKTFSLALALILSIGLATPAGAFFDMGKVGIHNTVSAGYSYTAAVNQSGTLMLNTSGWPNINFSKKIVSISNGQTEGAIIADDNSLWMWGENSYGQVGTRIPSPLKLTVLYGHGDKTFMTSKAIKPGTSERNFQKAALVSIKQFL